MAEAVSPAAARDRLALLLGAVNAPGSFSAKRTAAADGLHLDVRGVGPLQFPVPKEQLRQLAHFARPARYGLGELTLLDRRVRDTWEVPKSRVKIDQRLWSKTLLPVLDGLRADLGLPAECRLKAELHSMLVYGPGQFFAPHQDSEKADGMVGSLVVTLPGAFKGGALVVDHGAERATYLSSKDRLSFVAFYTDCRHEIRRVRSGHRIVLTYNLLLQGEAATTTVAEPAPETRDALDACVRDHFATPVPAPAWSRDRDSRDAPNRLVYLLDHEYTSRALSWTRLKGSDAARVAALRAAAERVDCEVVLALADVHETWDAFEDEESWHGRSRSWDEYTDDVDDEGWLDDGGGDDPDADYSLNELIESEISLTHWIDASGSPGDTIASAVAESEVCASTASDRLTPFASEYEGYMGNYGNTLDRWYHRGAVVLWPRTAAFVVRAQATPGWALGEVAARLKAGAVGEARELVTRLAPFWQRIGPAAEQRGVFKEALRAAGGIDTPEPAAMLLAPFRLEMLAEGDAKALSALSDRYGEAWLRPVVARWSRRERYWDDGAERGAWIVSLPALVAALGVVGETGTLVGRLLVGDAWNWLAGSVARCREIARPSWRADALDELVRPTLATLQSAAVVGAVEIRDQGLAVLGDGDDTLLRYLTGVVRAGAKLDAAVRAAAGLDSIAQHCARRLEDRLGRSPRSPDDWSIELPDGCACAVCHTLAAFLAERDERARDWPLAQDGRRHVHSRIDAAELPVSHQTRRKGRPYTLVLTKTADVFARETQTRLRDQADLSWLRASP